MLEFFVIGFACGVPFIWKRAFFRRCFSWRRDGWNLVPSGAFAVKGGESNSLCRAVEFFFFYRYVSGSVLGGSVI